MRNMASELTQASDETADIEERTLLVALLGAYRPNHLLQFVHGAPRDISAAHANAGGDFDFIYVDGDAVELGLLLAGDIQRMLPFLDESAYLLVHHAAHHRVAAAIDAALAAHPDELVDCGMVGRTAVWDVQRQAHYGGLRLLRYVRRRRLTVWQEGA